MKEQPIIICTGLIPKILDGSKTHTRRVTNPQPYLFKGIWRWQKSKSRQFVDINIRDNPDLLIPFCPYGQVGDRLWVREKYAFCAVDDKTDRALYADGTYKDRPHDRYDKTKLGWHPSIHLPRWASRITLEITGVRVEWLQEITEEGAIAEGCGDMTTTEKLWLARNTGIGVSSSAKCGFHLLWNSLRKDYPYESNPFVWVIRFRQILTDNLNRYRVVKSR